MPNPSDLIATIRAELARRNLKQVDLAKALGISESGVSERLNGRTQITVDELYIVAGLLDMPASALLSEPTAAAS